jgi:outer membrane protein assembly factor BamB
LHRGLLVFSNANDTVIAVNPSTGAMRWNYHRAPIGGMSVAGYAGVAAWHDKVYCAFSDGHVMAFDAAEGAPMWPPVDLSAEAEQTLGQLPKYFDVDTTPVVDRIAAGTVVYAGSYDGGVTALDAQSGARVWANDRVVGVTDLVLWTQPAHTPRDGGPTIPARRLLLAASGTTGLWALNPEDGTEVWRNRLPSGSVSAPVPVAGSLMVSTSKYGVFLLSPLNGKVIDGIDLGMRFSMVPAAHGFRVFLMSDGGAWLSMHITPPDRTLGTQG